jgi:predicted metalloprotease with PDZ domain
MSQHLWLYEGVTEYFAHLVQLQSGLLSEEEFIKNMREKMEQAEEFGAFSMTEMSRKVLTGEYKSKYNSVYNKGALVAFMLDLFIREKTGNAKDLKSVVQTLSAQYGPNKPFNDSTFFDEFVVASHPEVAGFVENYIKGSEILPYDQLFANIGFEYDKAKRQTLYKIGEKLTLMYDEPTKQFVFKEVGNNALDIKEGDVLTSIEGAKVDEESLNNLWEKYIQTNTDYGELTIVVNRKGSAKVLTGKLFKGVALIKHYLAPLQTTSDDQKQNWKQLRAS